MTFDPNNPNDLNRRRTAYGLGAGAWTAVIVVVALLILGAFYFASEGGMNTAANNPAPTARETTGSAPTSPAPQRTPPQPASPPAGQ